jgi:BMFP domain-containing protein YqiC
MCPHHIGANVILWCAKQVRFNWVMIDTLKSNLFGAVTDMVNRDALNDLASKITSLLPENVRQMQDDLESNIHSLLQNALAKMNLVTREEFDVQTALLQRTREKLEKLEKLLDELEQKNK